MARLSVLRKRCKRYASVKEEAVNGLFFVLKKMLSMPCLCIRDVVMACLYVLRKMKWPQC